MTKRDELKGEPIELRLSDLGSAGAALGERIIERLEAERDAAIARAEAAEGNNAALREREAVLTTEQEIVAMSFRYKELKHEITALRMGFSELRQQLEPLLNILVKREF